MNFNFTDFTKEVFDHFQGNISLEDITELLNVEDSYEKDRIEVVSNSIILNYIFFKGIKLTTEVRPYSNAKINYFQDFYPGVNMLIADNLKGKSSVLKLIKYALVGSNNHIKENIKKWIDKIILNFNIKDSEYTIIIDLHEGLFKRGCLIKGNFNKIEDETNVFELIFEAKSKAKYEEEIQNFFFKTFSYYSLRWTQKNSAKDKNNLIDAGTSWNTYFKTILLESKDSNMFYGSQGKKVFQMLLGLELTYAINRLSIKKDFVIDEKLRESQVIEKNNKDNNKEKEFLNNELNAINDKLGEIDKKKSDKVNLSDLYNEYTQVSNEIDNANSKHKQYSDELMSIYKIIQDNKSQEAINYQNIHNYQKDIVKNNKKIIDLNEYIEIGIFFSNLEIKSCPCCNNSLDKDRVGIKKSQHKCSLCDEDLPFESDVVEKDVYIHKINNMNTVNKNLEYNISQLEKANVKLNEEYKEYYKKSIHVGQLKNDLPIIDELNKKLKDIEDKINIEKSKYNPTDKDREELISKKAVIEYKLKEIPKQENKNLESYDVKISVLEYASRKLLDVRIVQSSEILNRLQDILLREINQIGLESISEIKISNDLDILYKQDGNYMAFDDITEGEQLRAKLAFYLSLIQLDIEYNYGKHTRLLIIDSPGKEEGDSKYLDGLSLILSSINSRFKDDLQIIIATAERKLQGIINNEIIYDDNTFVF